MKDKINKIVNDLGWRNKVVHDVKSMKMKNFMNHNQPQMIPGQKKRPDKEQQA